MSLKREYVERALNYHGQQLQKTWDEERGKEDLAKLKLTEPAFDTYTARLKHLTMNERRKGLNIMQFIARKADDLYQLEADCVAGADTTAEELPGVVWLPPYEHFVRDNLDSNHLMEFRLGNLTEGSIVYGLVVSANNVTRALIKPLCTELPNECFLADVTFKHALVPHEHMGALPMDSTGKPRMYTLNEYVRCKVVRIVGTSELVLSLKTDPQVDKVPLGLVKQVDLPKYYKFMVSKSDVPFEKILTENPEFKNPDCGTLYGLCGLNPRQSYSFLRHLKDQHPNEYACNLRRNQISEWAYQLVRQGIEHYNNNEHINAFQALDRALEIHPQNVEAMVARGAFYASQGSLHKAIDDFQAALDINPRHFNATTYMGETLIAIGQNYEDANLTEKAIKAYEHCIKYIPNHEQANHLLKTLTYIQSVGAKPTEEEASQATTKPTKQSDNLPTTEDDNVDDKEKQRMRELCTSLLGNVDSDDNDKGNIGERKSKRKKQRHGSRDHSLKEGSAENLKDPESLEELDRRIHELERRHKEYREREKRVLLGAKKSCSPPRMIDCASAKRHISSSRPNKPEVGNDPKPKLSFTIRRPDKMDKNTPMPLKTTVFGGNDSVRSRSKSSTRSAASRAGGRREQRRTRSRSRSGSRARGRRRDERTRYGRRRTNSPKNNSSRSRSRGRGRKRSRSRSTSKNSSPVYANRIYLHPRRRRSPSPFDPNYHSHGRRSRSRSTSGFRRGAGLRPRSRSPRVRVRQPSRSISRTRRSTSRPRRSIPSPCRSVIRDRAPRRSRSRSPAEVIRRRGPRSSEPQRTSPNRRPNVIQSDEPDWDADVVDIDTGPATKEGKSSAATEDDDVILIN